MNPKMIDGVGCCDSGCPEFAGPEDRPLNCRTCQQDSGCLPWFVNEVEKLQEQLKEKKREEDGIWWVPLAQYQSEVGHLDGIISDISAAVAEYQNDDLSQGIDVCFRKILAALERQRVAVTKGV